MADLLIEHLKSKCEEHSALSLLDHQWGFDKLLIPKALNTISSLFPHYSRHDESHSKQILVNIERLLGKNISLLTATDTWLILESAYWHDIGMVVPQIDIDEAWRSDEFKAYLESIANSKHHELHEFVKRLESNNISTFITANDCPTSAVIKLRELIAEWFRRKHPQRAEEIIQSPLASLGLSSPRTELIPARLFKILGKICLMHGAAFKELIGPNGLPFRETGLAQEDCHPRFVACLLRMGDLLDIDDNRFCPVMQGIAGQNRSSHSKAHEDKHAAIRHLRIDRERIEISSECSTIDGYLEASKWFDWLQNEIQDQMANWQDIVPSRELGLLPTLGPVNVKLCGDLQILDAGKRPQFSIDGEKAIKLLQGSNLYSSSFACIRELLQNAIDATLIKIWLKEKNKHSPQTWESPESARKILDNHKVSVEIIELESNKKNRTLWLLRITDNGTGISKSDLSYMIRIGASQKNNQRQQIIKSMPEWMKPSGAFGIGLQSSFLLSEKIQIQTKSIFSNESLNITLHSPTNRYEGLVQIRAKENDIETDYGSTIELELELDKIPDRWSVSTGNKLTMVKNLLLSSDPVLDDSFPIEAAKIADSVADFANLSILKVEAHFKQKDREQIEVITNQQDPKEIANPTKFYKIGEHALEISYTPNTYDRFARSENDIYYRGQPFEFKEVYIPHASITANILSGAAGNWLTASRDSITPQAESELESLLIEALSKKVCDDLKDRTKSEFLTNKEAMPALSLFLEAMAIHYEAPWSELASKTNNKWLDLEFNKTSLRAMFEKDEWTISFDSIYENRRSDICDIRLPETWDGTTSRIIFNEWLKTQGHSIQAIKAKQIPIEKSPVKRSTALSEFSLHEQKFKINYKLSKSQLPDYTEEALATRLAKALKGSAKNTRYILNDSNSKWKDLYLIENHNLRVQGLFETTYASKNLILLPYLFSGYKNTTNTNTVQASEDQLNRLCNHIKPLLANGKSTKEIKKTYIDLMDEIDLIMSNSEFKSEWAKAREEQ